MDDIIARELGYAMRNLPWDLLQTWLPQVESFVLEQATHDLRISQPEVVAKRLAGFFVQKPLHEGGLT